MSVFKVLFELFPGFDGRTFETDIRHLSDNQRDVCINIRGLSVFNTL
jgi:hypothetical protein